MPRIRHWFHVSHDINSDPEVIELTDKFGLTGLKVWLELLSIGDRNEGRLPELSQACVRQLSIKCNSTQTRVSLVCDWIMTRTWIVCDPSPRLRNWRNYNPLRGAKKSADVSPPTPTPHPTPHPTPLKKKNKSAAAPLSVVLPHWLSESDWQKFVDYRKDKGAKYKLTDIAAELTIQQLLKLKELGYDPAEVINEAIVRNWTGIKVDWIHKNGNNNYQPSQTEEDDLWPPEIKFPPTQKE